MRKDNPNWGARRPPLGRYVRSLIALLIPALVALALPAQLASAQGIDDLPPDSVHLVATGQPILGQPFTVQIVTNVATPAYGFGFQLEYDAVRLQVEARPDADGSPVGMQPGAVFLGAQRIRNSAQALAESGIGTLDVVYTLLPPAQAREGVGVLGQVTFTVLQEGQAQVRLINPRLIALEGGVARDITLTLGEPVLTLTVGAAQGAVTAGAFPRKAPGIPLEAVVIGLFALVVFLLLVILRLALRRSGSSAQTARSRMTDPRGT